MQISGDDGAENTNTNTNGDDHIDPTHMLPVDDFQLWKSYNFDSDEDAEDDFYYFLFLRSTYYDHIWVPY
jgi:hypothetical protein